MVTSINGINKIVNGGMPSMEIHLPPNCLRIGRLSLSAIRYMLGTIMSVIKNANASPKIIVHESGFQKRALSPPKKYVRIEICKHGNEINIETNCQWYQCKYCRQCSKHYRDNPCFTGLYYCFSCLHSPAS